MPSLIKRVLQATSPLLPASARRQLYKAGLAVGGDEAFPSVASTLLHLRGCGAQPERILDVGAYQGEWTRLAKTIFPAASLLMVEPQEAKRPLLNKVCADLGPSVTFETALLGSEDGRPVDFVVMETGSSVFEEQSDVPRTRVQTHTRTLDTLVADSRDWDRIDVLKLDVQGYELEVLRGASQLLPTCDWVLMEVSVVSVNAGAPTVEEVFEFMTECGFRMFDVCDQHRIDKTLVQVDLLFVNARSAFAARTFNDHTVWCNRHGIDPADPTAVEW